MLFDPIAPLPLGSFPLWHFPIPSLRLMTGDHPSSIYGFGEEIVEIREMEPSDSTEWYSPILSARMKKRMSVYHSRHEEVGIQLYLDVGPAMDFGVPSKRHVAVKVMSSLTANIFREPNQGTATFIGVGARTVRFAEIGDQVVASGALRRFAYNLAPYHGDARPLTKALKHHATETPEQFVCIFSDFLISPDDEDEWDNFENAYKRVGQQGSEVICIRILSPLECAIPAGSITVKSAENANWIGFGTKKELLKRQSRIRERLAHICSKPEIRFLEIVSDGNEDRLTAQVREFLQARKRYLRTHLDVAPS